MSNQQLKFSFTFISLGALLGWYAHSAYINSTDSNTTISAIEITEPEQSNKINPQPVLLIQKEEISTNKQFYELISNGLYEEALLLYQQAEAEEQASFFSVLITTINEFNKSSDPKVLALLNPFLQEYYNNTQLLLLQADAFILQNKTEQALDSFLLAKNYAGNNDDYNIIINRIHDFSKLAYKEFKLKKAWLKSIAFFTTLIENEPDFPYYHLCLAESYIQTGDVSLAIAPLKWIKDDIVYGKKAVELLDLVTLNQLSVGIDLIKSGQQYVVFSTLSDFYEVKLLLDTGASYSSLPSHVITRLVMEHQAEKIGHNQLVTAAGMVDADLYKLKKITIGGFTVNDIIVAELDLGSSPEANNDFSGLLGMNFLSHFDFVIDQKLNQLFLTPKFN